MLLKLNTLRTKERKQLISDGVFVFTGFKANIVLFKGNMELNQWGYIKTNENICTNIDGVYTVGDVIIKKYRQITTDVADRTIAAFAI